MNKFIDTTLLHKHNHVKYKMIIGLWNKFSQKRNSSWMETISLVQQFAICMYMNIHEDVFLLPILPRHQL